ncbi:hypothetical protein [Mesoplasma melaleucae]|nr:hypothetical protein [Mesoplasma melaleucae]
MQNELKILTTKEEHYKMVFDQNVTDEWNPVNFAKIIKEKIK